MVIEPPACLTVHADGPVTHIAFCTAELTDDLLIEQIGQYLHQLAVEHPNGKVVLDFTGLTRCISRMFGVLAAFHHQAAKAGIQLRLCALDASLLEALKITRLDSRFRITPDYAQAVASLR